MPRPCEYTPELGKTICERIASGESLNKICKDEAMPARSTVITWALFWDKENNDLKEFSDKYARARQVQAELLGDGIFDIADDVTGDIVVAENGKETVNYENIARSRLKVDTRKWYLSKVLPKVYGDKLQLDAAISGGVKLKIGGVDIKDV